MNINRRMSLILAIAMILSALLAPWAVSESATVYAAREDAPVYDESGSVIATVPLNTALTLTGVKGSVCRVELNGHVGYMKKGDLKQSADQPQPEPEQNTGTAYVGKDGAKVYNAGGKVIARLSLNEQVTVTGMKDGICRVTRNGATGYMRREDLSATRVEKEPTAVTAYVNREGAKLYGEDGATLATLALNTAVSVTAVKGDACRVNVDSRTGIMRRGDLSKEKTPNESDDAVNIPETTAYVKNDGAKVYDAGGRVITTLSAGTAVTVSAYTDNLCKVVNGSATGYMRRDDLTDEKPQVTDGPGASLSTVPPAKGTAIEMDWWTSDIQNIFARGTVAQITDVQTGLSWREQRRGGTNHADCQPLTAADTAALKQAYGGTWSWDRRPIFVTINGVNYAASMNGMPHGGGAITDNNFNGHHCIHFTNSRTHGSNKVCQLHQAAIKKAASTTLR